MKLLVKRNKRILKKLSSYWPLILFSCILLYVTRGLIFDSGYVMYGEFFGSKNYLFFLKEFLQPWGNYSTLGHSNIGFPETYGNPHFFITPVGLLVPWIAIFSFIQVFIGDNVSRVYSLFFLSIPFFGMYWFANIWFGDLHLKKNTLRLFAFSAAIIYTITDVLGDRMFAGHLMYVFGIGLFPIYCGLLIRALREASLNRILGYTLLVGIVTFLFIWTMPHALILSAIVIGLYLLLIQRPFISSIKRISGVLVGSVVVCIMLMVYAWLPAIFFSEVYPFFPQSMFLTSYLYNLAPNTTLDKVVTLLGSYTGKIVTREVFSLLFFLRLILPLLALMSMVLVGGKRSLFLLLVAISGIVLSLGINYPFTDMYLWLYQKVPLFSMFRDSSKFLLLYSFAMSLAVPMLIYYLYKSVSRLFLLSIPVLLLFVLWINPIFSSGTFGGNAVTVTVPEKYYQLQALLAEDRENAKVAMYPNDKSVKDYLWYPPSPIPNSFPSIFSVFYPLNKELAVSNRVPSDYSSRYLTFIESNLDKLWAVERLIQAGVKYIIVDQDLPGNERYIQMFSGNIMLKQTEAPDGFRIWMVKEPVLAITHKQPIYYIGNMSGYQFISSEIAIIDLGVNPLSVLEGNYSQEVIFYGASIEDIVLSSNMQYAIPFEKPARSSVLPMEQFLLKGHSMLDDIQRGYTIYNSHALYTSGNATITSSRQFEKGSHLIYIRTIPKPGNSDSIVVRIDEHEYKRNSLQGGKWIKVGSVELPGGPATVSLENIPPLPLTVDALVVIPEEKFIEDRKKINALLENKKVISLSSSSSVMVNMNNKEAYVVSTSYSPYWRFCGESKPVRVNYYAMGFFCNDGDERGMRFTPSTLFYISHIFSGVMLLTVCVGSLVLLRRNSI